MLGILMCLGGLPVSSSSSLWVRSTTTTAGRWRALDDVSCYSPGALIVAVLTSSTQQVRVQAYSKASIICALIVATF